jgi:hypothetical protein
MDIAVQFYQRIRDQGSEHMLTGKCYRGMIDAQYLSLEVENDRLDRANAAFARRTCA